MLTKFFIQNCVRSEYSRDTMYRGVGQGLKFVEQQFMCCFHIAVQKEHQYGTVFNELSEIQFDSIVKHVFKINKKQVQQKSKLCALFQSDPRGFDVVAEVGSYPIIFVTVGSTQISPQSRHLKRVPFFETLTIISIFHSLGKIANSKDK